MKKYELNQMKKEQLRSTLSELRKELIKINTQISTGATPENPGKARQIKKTIARILTKLNNKVELNNKTKEDKQKDNG